MSQEHKPADIDNILSLATRCEIQCLLFRAAMLRSVAAELVDSRRLQELFASLPANTKVEKVEDFDESTYYTIKGNGDRYIHCFPTVLGALEHYHEVRGTHVDPAD